ncbi:aldehyde dehydrogenase family protein [Luteibacter sp.]|uniref:aldehyde dehydrogenase family protein n=1 Tax=Luteibacter sp. TaxID=1886636 RepID=UPI0039C8C2CC
MGSATVVMQPVGVAGLITPWNSNAGFICGKLAAAIAAGCTASHQAQRNERAADPDRHRGLA